MAKSQSTPNQSPAKAQKGALRGPLLGGRLIAYGDFVKPLAIIPQQFKVLCDLAGALDELQALLKFELHPSNPQCVLSLLSHKFLDLNEEIVNQNQNARKEIRDEK